MACPLSLAKRLPDRRDVVGAVGVEMGQPAAQRGVGHGADRSGPRFPGASDRQEVSPGAPSMPGKRLMTIANIR